MAQQRFASLTGADLIAKRAQITPKNTTQANLRSARTLRSYLREKKQDVDFEKYSPQRLNETLAFFYLDARKPDGELYKLTSLENFRYSLNRYLKSPPILARFDIIKDTAFIEANESFKTALGEIKQAGKGDIQHYPEIGNADLRRLYGSLQLDPSTPHGLANKVQFDVRLYFCRRGGENMYDMKKDAFSVKIEPETGRRFIEKSLDEMTKNRRAQDKEGYGGVMPEIPGSQYCPVKSFMKYLDKLHPELERLWQRPKDSFITEEPCWFYKRPLGKDTLSHFMSNLSTSCGLSQNYTNHSIRVTGATILSRGNFSPAQIMSITGHKAVSSLSVYQRVNNDEKLSMGNAISDAVVPAVGPLQPINPNSMSTSSSTSPPTHTQTLHCQNEPTASTCRSGALSCNTSEPIRNEVNASAISDVMSLSSEDWENFFSAEPVDNSVNTVNVVHQSNSRPAPLFQNCTIGKVEIVIRK